MYHNNRLSIMKLNQLIKIINYKEIRSTPQKQIIITTFVMIKDIILYFICSRMVPQEPIKVDQAHSRVAA